MGKVISFPHLGNYYIVFNYFLSNILKCKVVIPPSGSRRTIELGSKYSPDFVCTPFKYNLGNYIEALEMGANILIQGGGGCRYGYYGELQEKILKDLGYDFEFYNLIYDNHISLKKFYRFCKKINGKCNIFRFMYYLINSLLMIIFIDKIERYIRLNMGFEIVSGDFERLEKEYLDSFNNNGIIKNIIIYYRYKKKFRNIKINKSIDCLRVRIVGELFSLIDSNTSFNIERKLIKMGIEVYRDTDLTYLLITKRFILHRMLKRGKKYIKYHLGADGTASVVRSIDSSYMDGILHLKSFGCTPEIAAMSILSKISSDYKIPILYFSFDSEDNEVGIDTRLEAFYDMIKRRKID